jgi:general secretion pathway protein C
MKRPELRRPAVAAGALTAAGLLAILLLPPATTESVVEPAPAAPQPPMPAPPATEPPQPAPTADGLRLFGLLGLGAVISVPDGRQSFFAIGREVRPGLRVSRIEQNHVVLASTGGEVRLGFDGASPVEGPVAASPGGGGERPATGEARMREEALAYRFGLAPRRENGRVTGYALRPNAQLPMLRRAGLRPGDIIVSVNGQTFDSDEKVLELPREIAGSFDAEFEYERAGQRMRASIEVNPRSGS